MSSDKFHLNAGSYQLLNDATVPFSSRLKLCRALWVSKEYVIPRKHQLLINWLCSQMSSIVNVDSDFLLCNKTVIEFLNSKSLEDDLTSQTMNISIKPVVAQTISEYLTKYNDAEILECLITISEIMLTENWITCGLTSQYEQLAIFTSSWINFSKSQIEINSSTIELVTFLLKKRLKFSRGVNAMNKALLPFCKHLLLSMLELHYKCFVWQKNDVILNEALPESIESNIASVLFTRDNSKLFDDLAADFTGQKNDNEDANRRNKKVQRSKRLAVVMCVLQEISTKNSSDEFCAAHCTKLFFQLFLTNCNSGTVVKIKMLQELLKLGCMHDIKCSDVTNCANLNLNTLQGLLQLALDNRIYQPAVNTEESEKLLIWLKDILESLVNQFNPSSNWMSCIMLLAEIDKSIVEPRLKSVLLKLAEKGDLTHSISIEKIHELTHCLVDVYVKIRQSLRLSNIVMIVIEGFVTTENTDTTNVKRMTNIVEEFGLHLGKQFLTKLSPSLIVEIWSSVLEKINSEVEKISKSSESEEDPPLRVISLQVLLAFFNKIVIKSPIFALWDHLIVRQKMIECFKSLRSSVKTLHGLHLSNKTPFLNEKVMENFLIAHLIETKISISLEDYVEVKSGIVSPGCPAMLFENEPKVRDCSQDLIDDFSPTKLMLTDAKLNFIHILLLKIKKLWNEIAILEILVKAGKLDVADATTSSDSSKQKLDNFVEKLESILQDIKTPTQDLEKDEDELFLGVFILLTNFSTILFHLDIVKIQKWIITAIVLVMFSERLKSSLEIRRAISEFFSCISNLSNSSITYDVLCTSCIKLSEFIPGICSLSKLSLDISTTANQIGLLIEKKTYHEKTKFVSSAMEFHNEILNLCNLQNLSLEESSAVFAHVLSCVTTVECALEKFNKTSDNSKINIAPESLKRIVQVLLKLTNNKRIPLLQYCNPEKLFMYLARLKSLVGCDIQEELSAILHELIFSCYHNSTENAFAMLKKGLAWKMKNKDLDMDTLTHHIEAMVDILSFEDGTESFAPITKFNSKSRKRKLRDEIQICKKLKLDITDVKKQTMLFDSLEQLYQEVCGISKIENINFGKSYFEMLSACVKAFKLLNSNEERNSTNIDKIIFAKLTNALEDLHNERQIENLIAKLHFIRLCLQLEELEYTYHSSHLKNLIQCYESISSDSQAQIELEKCIFHFVKKIPGENFQKDLFNETIYSLRFGDDKNVENYIKFSLVLLQFNLPSESGQGENTKVEKGVCSRFVKSLLETLTIMITTRSKDLNSLDNTVLTLVNKTITAIVKTKLIRLQTTEICSIFMSLHNIPLEKMHDTKGAEFFYEVFTSCCDVVHCILLNHKEIGKIAAICNAGFRKLLKAAMHLGIQKRNTATEMLKSVKEDRSYNTAIQCAGKLEKLFQLVADNYKREFSKCMSYLVADYTCILTSYTIVPFVKKPFTNAIYHFVSMMDEYDTAMIRKALPPGVRDNFQELFLDYGRSFKYKGFV